MPKTTPAALVVAVTTAHLPDNLTITEGALFDATDPIVEMRPELFKPQASSGTAGAALRHS